MLQEEEALEEQGQSQAQSQAVGTIQNKASLDSGSYAVIAVCAVLSMIFMKSGFLSFFFLVPLGYALLATGSIWLVFIASTSLNIVISLLLHIFVNRYYGLWMNIFYFSVVFLMFLWILSGKSLRTSYRFVIASLAGVGAFFVVFTSGRDNGFNVFLNEAAKILSSMFAPAGGGSSAQAVTPESIMEMIKSVSIRGGAFISMMLIFYINYQITLAAYLLIKRRRTDHHNLINFFAPYNAIWVLTGALATVIMTNVIKISFIEIIAWNVLTICAVLFLAQGAGILLFLLLRRSMAFRLTANILIFILIISPFNTIVFAALLILGIVEIWVPLRVNRAES